jgi:hypothetical protein
VTLTELLNGIDNLDDDATIFVDRSAGLSGLSPAEIEIGDMKESSEGLARLLEVYLAKEVLQVWTEWRGGRQPSPEQRCRAVIWYVEKDSYMPEEADS